MDSALVVIGVFAGLWLMWRCADLLLILYYQSRYQDKESYLALYDLLDDEYSYKVMQRQDPIIATYDTYLKLHQQARKDAYKYFIRYYHRVSRNVALHCILFLFAPSLVLFSKALWFAIPALVVFVLGVFYKRFVKKIDTDFAGRMMLAAVLKQYLAK
ncbi:MAG: hypothetical protein V4702_04000 [Patescibacteria group bacterium]